MDLEQRMTAAAARAATCRRAGDERGEDYWLEEFNRLEIALERELARRG